MNKETIEALHGSIKKWDCIAQGLIADEGGDNCPLCKLFFDNNSCYGCPIPINTGIDCCDGTPYDSIVFIENIDITSHLEMYGLSDLQFQAISDEVEFLIKLLPVSEQAMYAS